MPPSKSSPPRHTPSLLQRWLEPLGATIWILFLVWTVLILMIWLTGVGDVELARSIKDPDLRKALEWLLLAGDGIWVLLAAANMYLSLAVAEGLKTARFRAAILLAAAWGASALASRTNLPLGPIRYTGRLGVHLGPVPFGAPLLWYALINGARAAAMRLAPRARHESIAVLTALLTVITDFNLEPIAWKQRVWWLWYPALTPAPAWPPMANYGTWFVLSGALALAFREGEVAGGGRAASNLPIIAFAIMNGVFLVSHFAAA